MHDLTPLYEYINAQRRAGVNDGVTYHRLTSAGWSPEVVAQALNRHNQQPAHQPASDPGQQPQVNNQPAQQQTAKPASQSRLKSLFTGRIGRLGFFIGNLYIILLLVALSSFMLITGFIFNTSLVMSLINLLLMLAVVPLSILLTFSIFARRWHDIGQSGWFTLFIFACGSLILFVILVIPKGDNKANQYGELPTEKLSPKAVFNF